MNGNAGAYGMNCKAIEGAVSATLGARSATGVARTNGAAATMDFGAESQARMEQSFCPGVLMESQRLLSRCSSLDWLW